VACSASRVPNRRRARPDHWRCRHVPRICPSRRWPARCGRTALVAIGLVQAHSRGSQHVDLVSRSQWVEAVLDQLADRPQASQRPPRADHVEVDVGTVAGDDVAKVLLVSERQAGEVEQGIALARLASPPGCCPAPSRHLRLRHQPTHVGPHEIVCWPRRPTAACG
jgi:hypothetical protein